MSTDCVFCRELEGRSNTNFARLYPEVVNRIIYKTDSFAAFPCIGQLAPDHFLIVPRYHHSTFRQVLREDKLISELNKLIEGVHRSLKIDLANSLFFEHGAIDSTAGGCGIYHAHLHVIPNVENLDPRSIFDFSSAKIGNSIPDVIQNISPESSYAMAGSFSSGFYAQQIAVALPSQTLRKNVANALGQPVWDWRLAKSEQSLIDTINKAAA